MQKKITVVVVCDMQTTKANSQWELFLEMWLCSCCLSRGHGEPWDQRSSGDDLGNQDLFRQYYRDKEMSEDDDPFLLIRDRFADRKGLLPPPLLRQWWSFHVCVGLWRYDGTCILSGRRQGYRETYLLVLFGKEELQRFISQVCLSSPKFGVNFLYVMLCLFRHGAQTVVNV